MRYLVVALALAAASASVAQGTFHGNAARTGVYTSAGPAQLHGVKWSFDTGGPVYASPVVADTIIYIASGSGALYAIDARTGKLAWEFRTDASKQDPIKVLNPDGSLNADAFAPVFRDFQDTYIDLYRFRSIGAILSSPAVDAGVVYIGSLDGHLYALH